jgi:hypothetical protein
MGAEWIAFARSTVATPGVDAPGAFDCGSSKGAVKERTKQAKKKLLMELPRGFG